MSEPIREAARTDWASVVARTPRKTFVAAHRHFFLVGEPALQRPFSPTRTVPLFAPALRSLATMAPSTAAVCADVPQQTQMVLAIVKSQPVFPDMVTVGRTANNDIVIPDVTVSKFHAWFRTVGGRLELVEAGSRNGTKVSGKAVPPKDCAHVPVLSRLSFGAVELVVHDAETCWDAVRAWADALAARAG